MFRISHAFVFIVVVSVLVAFGAYLFFTSKIVWGATEAAVAVRLHDSYDGKVHHIEGTVPVPAVSTRVVMSGDVRADTLVLFFASEPRDQFAVARGENLKDAPFTATVEGDVAEYYLAEVNNTIIPVYPK